MLSTPQSASPYPLPDPLKRLHVYDGLMMNARRWLLAEDYQRRRQNLQYQSVNQAGIVCGLGVRVIPAPESVDQRFRDARWIEIQPGVAIDQEGNPILVDAAPDRTYRIDARPPSGGSLTVHIVVSYAEPTHPSSQQRDETIREWFRFDQITEPPNGQQVELCRILLVDPVRLSQPTQFFSPQPNQLDFRYRLQAGARPAVAMHIGMLQFGQIEAADLATYTLYQRSRENVAELLHSFDSLYPSLQGSLAAETVRSLTLDPAVHSLLFLPDGQLLLQATPAEREALKRYLQQGGGLIIEATDETIQSIQQAIEVLLPTEQSSPWSDWKDLDRLHPLRRTPFLFGSLSDLSLSIQLYSQGSVLLVQGQLSAAWGLADGRWLSRSEIRSAQELGINLLHFFWQRRQFVELTQWSTDENGTDQDQ